jgi:hypothetical protein
MSREQPPFMRCVIGGVRLLVSLATGLRSAVRGVARPGIPGARRWNHERMADDDPSGDRVAKEWPLEGHFVVDGSGLHVHTDCLGGAFTSRTANYDLTIGLPQLDPGSTPPGRVIPPEWTYGPRDESEPANERDVIPWGWAPGYGAKKVYPENAKDAAIVARCRFYTTLTASNDEEFKIAADDFLTELDIGGRASLRGWAFWHLRTS